MSKATTIKQNSRLNLCELLNDSTEGNNKRWNAYANVYDLSKALRWTKQHSHANEWKRHTHSHTMVHWNLFAQRCGVKFILNLQIERTHSQRHRDTNGKNCEFMASNKKWMH